MTGLGAAWVTVKKERSILFSIYIYIYIYLYLYISFLRKEWKRMERSFESHKSPKTQKKNGKERNILFKERNVLNGKECGAQPWLESITTLLSCLF